MEALHMSGTIAHALANSMQPLLRADGTFDLVDARQHNLVEHDRSLTRLDFRQGDNYTLQPQSKLEKLDEFCCNPLTVKTLVLQAMLDDAEGGDLTLKTMAKTYIRRREEHKKSGGDSLGLSMWFKDMLIVVGFINSEATGHPTPEHTRLFYTEERFADYILENPEQRTLHGLVFKAMRLWWHVHFW